MHHFRSKSVILAVTILVLQMLVPILSFSLNDSFCTKMDQSALRKLTLRAHEEVDPSEPNKAVTRRRTFMMMSLATASALVTKTQSANAYEKIFPDELASQDGDSNTRQGRMEHIRTRENNRIEAVSSNPLIPPASTLTWAVALWLLSGSRSNPLVTPLANVFYDGNKESWLKDRNEGLFSALPLAFSVFLGIVFLGLGYVTDGAVVQLAEGDRGLSFQLAGVSLIAGGTLELGRIASGEKKQTRDESDRDTQLEEEFAEFAAKRLQFGAMANCHRNDVIRSFRRYYAKYRQADNPDYPLADIEIERLLRDWSRQYPGVEMSSAGFYSGIQINKDADVFAQR